MRILIAAAVLCISGFAQAQAPAQTQTQTQGQVRAPRQAARQPQRIVLVDRIVAIVGREVVTASELGERREFAERQLQGQGTPLPERGILERQILERLILDKAQLQLAKDSGIAINVTPWFTTGDVLPEIGPVQEFYKSALSLRPKEVSPVIEGSNAYYLLTTKERQEPAIPPLDAVRANLETELRESKAYEMAAQRANASLEQLTKEKDITKLARDKGVTLEETGWFLRGAPQIPKIGELKELPPGGLALSAQKPLPDKILLLKDEALLFAFKDSQGADMEQFEKEKDSLMKQAVGESRQRILQKFKDGLKAKAKIEIHAAVLEEI